ncbi:MAG TPA: tRNA uridine-5-carboxymethylaminomethyl(34) synthesis GTPase MnmE [Pyrinomonadaceae bacterium]|nr:tRNA uridine-5-carboxymethylaminomethyl(34) synthesis GTPase MnmE [Pyrinomonadaceae bacterium]
MNTIVAVATPPGRSAIGMIRISGPQSLPILRALVQDVQLTPEPNRTTLRELFQPDSVDVIDSALVTYFQAPHSFTGEDMVEISCHGSPVIIRQLIDQIQRLDACLAGPGEFTLRAHKNGKLNLSQAEAIRDLINARTVAAAQQATRQLAGELSNALQSCQNELIQLIVKLESALEFVEDDLPQTLVDENVDHVDRVVRKLREMASTFATGHLLRDGIQVALVGRPNVGKSSIFNRLVRFDRAIVTELPGTTRDSLVESISIRGIPLSITDTAGIREAGDRIEALGIERTQRAISDADLVVVVIDGSSDLFPEDEALLAEVEAGPRVVAVNKSDLGSSPQVLSKLQDLPAVVHVSALTGEGLQDLTTAILKPFATLDSESVGLLVTDSRHHDLLLRALSSLEESKSLLSENASEELVLVGLHNALKLLGEITGETTTEDILGQIFSTFCIGK